MQSCWLIGEEIAHNTAIFYAKMGKGREAACMQSVQAKQESRCIFGAEADMDQPEYLKNRGSLSTALYAKNGKVCFTWIYVKIVRAAIGKLVWRLIGKRKEPQSARIFFQPTTSRRSISANSAPITPFRTLRGAVLGHSTRQFEIQITLFFFIPVLSAKCLSATTEEASPPWPSSLSPSSSSPPSRHTTTRSRTTSGRHRWAKKV